MIPGMAFNFLLSFNIWWSSKQSWIVLLLSFIMFYTKNECLCIGETSGTAVYVGCPRYNLLYHKLDQTTL